MHWYSTQMIDVLMELVIESLGNPCLSPLFYTAVVAIRRGPSSNDCTQEMSIRASKPCPHKVDVSDHVRTIMVLNMSLIEFTARQRKQPMSPSE